MWFWTNINIFHPTPVSLYKDIYANSFFNLSLRQKYLLSLWGFIYLTQGRSNSESFPTEKNFRASTENKANFSKSVIKLMPISSQIYLSPNARVFSTLLSLIPLSNRSCSSLSQANRIQEDKFAAEFILRQADCLEGPIFVTK